MKQENILYWAPRIMAIVFILFLGIFALDVVTPGMPVLSMMVGLFIHLIPNFLLLTLLLLAWKKERLGGILFLITGVFLTIFFQTYLYFINFLLISFPIFLIGLLFITHSKLKELSI